MKLHDWFRMRIRREDIIVNAVDPTGFDRDNIIVPLGTANAFIDFSKKNNYSLFTNHPKMNTKLLLYSFNTKSGLSRKRFTTNNLNMDSRLVDRASIKKTLDKTYSMTAYTPDTYFKNICKFKFVISPEGNGLDCYRHYETWISKGIPIIEYNAFIEKKYSTLPILWTRDYAEINDNYLKSVYPSFFKKNYDFRRLLLGYYKKPIQAKIKQIMNKHVKGNGETPITMGYSRYWTI
jgi:hypothetical protein